MHKNPRPKCTFFESQYSHKCSRLLTWPYSPTSAVIERICTSLSCHMCSIYQNTWPYSPTSAVDLMCSRPNVQAFREYELVCLGSCMVNSLSRWCSESRSFPCLLLITNFKLYLITTISLKNVTKGIKTKVIFYDFIDIVY